MNAKLPSLVATALVVVLLFLDSTWAAEGPIFRSGDELIVQIKQLDQLRNLHKQLIATVRYRRTTGTMPQRSAKTFACTRVAGRRHGAVSFDFRRRADRRAYHSVRHYDENQK